MPILKKITIDNTDIYIYRYVEGDLLDLDKNLELKKKNIESLMIRNMLKKFLPNHRILYYDSGEPYLEPSGLFISISHSFPYAVLAVSEKRIGIDIELNKDKIEKVKEKFLHKNEVKWLEQKENKLEYLVCIWSIKESLFKIHSSKQWSFREFYEVDEFHLKQESEINCRVLSKNSVDEFIATIEYIEGFYLTIVKEKKPI